MEIICTNDYLNLLLFAKNNHKWHEVVKRKEEIRFLKKSS